MGYSISVRARSEALAIHMERFFEREYRTWQQVWGQEEGDPYSSQPHRDIDYAPSDSRKTLIGIDYGAIHGYERLYAYTLVRWIALKIGRKRRSFTEPKVKLDAAVPYLIYDVETGWPILVRPMSEMAKELRWCCCDELGLPLKPPLELQFEVDAPIRTEAFAKALAKFGSHGHETSEYAIELMTEQLLPLMNPLHVEMQRLDQLWQQEV